MKSLYILRHAKSSWANLNLKDLERPLNARGRRDAPVMGQVLSEVTKNIDALIISPSERTKQTANIFREYVRFDSESIVDRLYHASMTDIEDVISMIDNSRDTVLLIGHNPGLTYLYNHYAKEQIDNLPTSGLFRISAKITEWSDLDSTNARVDYYKYPKMFSK